MKYCRELANQVIAGRAPQGARGLKCSLKAKGKTLDKSRPARGAWVEIRRVSGGIPIQGSRPARGAWVEIHGIELKEIEKAMSRPARGAWVEIPTLVYL